MDDNKLNAPDRLIEHTKDTIPFEAFSAMQLNSIRTRSKSQYFIYVYVALFLSISCVSGFTLTRQQQRIKSPSTTTNIDNSRQQWRLSKLLLSSSTARNSNSYPNTPGSERIPQVALLLHQKVDPAAALGLSSSQGYQVTAFYLQRYDNMLTNGEQASLQDICADYGIPMEVMEDTSSRVARQNSERVLSDARERIKQFQLNGFDFDYVATWCQVSIQLDERSDGMQLLQPLEDSNGPSFLLCMLNREQLNTLVPKPQNQSAMSVSSSKQEKNIFGQIVDFFVPKEKNNDSSFGSDIMDAQRQSSSQQREMTDYEEQRTEMQTNNSPQSFSANRSAQSAPSQPQQAGRTEMKPNAPPQSFSTTRLEQAVPPQQQRVDYTEISPRRPAPRTVSRDAVSSPRPPPLDPLLGASQTDARSSWRASEGPPSALGPDFTGANAYPGTNTASRPPPLDPWSTRRSNQQQQLEIGVTVPSRTLSNWGTRDKQSTADGMNSLPYAVGNSGNVAPSSWTTQVEDRGQGFYGAKRVDDGGASILATSKSRDNVPSSWRETTPKKRPDPLMPIDPPQNEAMSSWPGSTLSNGSRRNASQRPMSDVSVSLWATDSRTNMERRPEPLQPIDPPPKETVSTWTGSTYSTVSRTTNQQSPLQPSDPPPNDAVAVWPGTTPGMRSEANVNSFVARSPVSTELQTLGRPNNGTSKNSRKRSSFQNSQNVSENFNGDRARVDDLSRSSGTRPSAQGMERNQQSGKNSDRRSQGGFAEVKASASNAPWDNRASPQQNIRSKSSEESSTMGTSIPGASSAMPKGKEGWDKNNQSNASGSAPPFAIWDPTSAAAQSSPSPSTPSSSPSDRLSRLDRLSSPSSSPKFADGAQVDASASKAPWDNWAPPPQTAGNTQSTSSEAPSTMGTSIPGAGSSKPEVKKGWGPESSGSRSSQSSSSGSAPPFAIWDPTSASTQSPPSPSTPLSSPSDRLSRLDRLSSPSSSPKFADGAQVDAAASKAPWDNWTPLPQNSQSASSETPSKRNTSTSGAEKSVPIVKNGSGPSGSSRSNGPRDALPFAIPAPTSAWLQDAAQDAFAYFSQLTPEQVYSDLVQRGEWYELEQFPSEILVTPKTSVERCSSRVSIQIGLYQENGEWVMYKFQGETDATVTCGLIQILSDITQEVPVNEVMSVSPYEIVNMLGLDAALSRSDSSEMGAIWNALQQQIKETLFGDVPSNSDLEYEPPTIETSIPGAGGQKPIARTNGVSTQSSPSSNPPSSSPSDRLSRLDRVNSASNSSPQGRALSTNSDPNNENSPPLNSWTPPSSAQVELNRGDNQKFEQENDWRGQTNFDLDLPSVGALIPGAGQARSEVKSGMKPTRGRAESNNSGSNDQSSPPWNTWTPPPSAQMEAKANNNRNQRSGQEKNWNGQTDLNPDLLSVGASIPGAGQANSEIKSNLRPRSESNTVQQRDSSSSENSPPWNTWTPPPAQDNTSVSDTGGNDPRMFGLDIPDFDPSSPSTGTSIPGAGASNKPSVKKGWTPGGK